MTSVESDAGATEHAAENLADWLGAAAATARVERWVRGARRAAAPGSVRDSRRRRSCSTRRARARVPPYSTLVAVLEPAQIVYVACDPVAFARDVALLAGHGYELTELRAFDLFPHTHHVEAIGSFRRA